MTTQEQSQPQQEQQLDTETSLDEATLDGVVGGAAPTLSPGSKVVLGGYKDYDPDPVVKPVVKPTRNPNKRGGLA